MVSSEEKRRTEIIFRAFTIAEYLSKSCEFTNSKFPLNNNAYDRMSTYDLLVKRISLFNYLGSLVYSSSIPVFGDL